MTIEYANIMTDEYAFLKLGEGSSDRGPRGLVSHDPSRDTGARCSCLYPAGDGGEIRVRL